MKKYAFILVGLAVLLGSPVIAEEMKSDKAMMKHDAMMCEKHCNIMDLEKKVNGLKSQAAGADKTTTKEHLKKDIEVYEKKLNELKKELEAE